MILFSATYEQDVLKFAHSVVPNPVVIRLHNEGKCLSNIRQYYINCLSREDKLQALSNLYGAISIGQSMIFCHVSWEEEATNFYLYKKSGFGDEEN